MTDRRTRGPAARAGARRRIRWILLALALSSVAPAAQAQRLATLELGFGGALVADAWNPLRLVLRDVGPVDLEIVIDQGSLRDGPLPLSYRTRVAGGSGLSVFDDELFVPAWRSLSWTVRAGSVTVASGSLPRADADRRVVDLIVTDAPGPWRGLLDDGARAIDVAPERLLPRSAAFDGVRSLIVAGGELPRVEALIAAAAAGAVVVLSEAAAQAAELAPLMATVPGAWHRIGPGWLVTEQALAQGPAVLEAARFEQSGVVSAIAATNRLRLPSSVPTLTLLFGAAAYGLAVLVVLRFGGLPGIVAAGALAATASLLAYQALRPPSPTLTASRDVVIGGGSLGQRWRVHEVASLPAADVRIGAPARPAVPQPLTSGPTSTVLTLDRWRSQQVVERPRVVDALLRWQEDGSLANDGPRALAEVHVKGGPSYGAVAPRSLATAPARDPIPPSTVARALLDVIPVGSAIGTDGTTWYVALALQPTFAASRPSEEGAP